MKTVAREMAGSHRKWESFAWHRRPDDEEDWCIVYTHNRDSGLLDQSNADAIAAELERFTEGDDPDVVSEHHGHWAFGWVDGFAIRVYRQADGGGPEVTDAFKAWCRLQVRLADYPVLDEEGYSRREYDAALEAISNEGRRHVRDDVPDDWPSLIFSWLWDNDQRELENRDDQGAAPSTEAVRQALRELDLLDCIYQVTVEDSIVLETQSKAKAESEFGTLAYHASMGLLGREQEKVCLWCDDEILDQYPE